MFYGVYYYHPINGPADVYLVGFYNNLDMAKAVLHKIMPDYEKHYKNTVKGNRKIGWINQYEMNEHIYNPTHLTCSQPHASIELFDNN